MCICAEGQQWWCFFSACMPRRSPWTWAAPPLREGPVKVEAMWRMTTVAGRGKHRHNPFLKKVISVISRRPPLPKKKGLFTKTCEAKQARTEDIDLPTFAIAKSIVYQLSFRGLLSNCMFCSSKKSSTGHALSGMLARFRTGRFLSTLLLWEGLEHLENRGTLKWMVYNGKPYKMDDLGVPLFLETPISTWQWQDSQLITIRPCPHSDSLCWDVHLLGVCMPLWPSWARGPGFFLKKKKTNAKQRHLTCHCQTPFLGFPTHSGVPSGHFPRIPKHPKRPNPNLVKGFRPLGSQADSAKCGFRPLAENLGSWRSQLPTAARPRGCEAIAEIPNGLASETLQNLIKLRRDQGGKVIFVREKLIFF